MLDEDKTRDRSDIDKCKVFYKEAEVTFIAISRITLLHFECLKFGQCEGEMESHQPIRSRENVITRTKPVMASLWLICISRS